MAIVVRTLITNLLSRCPAEWRPTWAAAYVALTAAVFAFLDALDALLCLAYAFIDGVLEDSPAACCCRRRRSPADADDEEGVSDTLFLRRSFCRDALLRLVGAAAASVRRFVKSRSGGGAPEKKGTAPPPPRWSDCGCDACTAWQRKTAGAGDDDNDGGERRPLLLHSVVVHDPRPAHDKAADADAMEEEEHPAAAAVFIHGFTSSSAFWTETVFPQLNRQRRLLAVDLLGFGASPKPSDCAYTLRDHVSAIERTAMGPLQNPSSFHLVAHSMGCIVALALAAKHPDRVKSLTLIAPPYFRGEGRPVAEKKLWPPLQFGAAVMTWYEHIGRTVCFLVCKHHRLWEALLLGVCNLLPATTASRTGRLLRDLTRHTHRSAWRTMHNVVCGGARAVERSLDALAPVPVRVVHGGGDRVVPVECARELKSRLPRAELRVLDGCDHRTVVFGREKEFAGELRAFWEGSEKNTEVM